MRYFPTASAAPDKPTEQRPAAALHGGFHGSRNQGPVSQSSYSLLIQPSFDLENENGPGVLQSCERKAGSGAPEQPSLSWSDAHFRLQPAHNRKTDKHTNLPQLNMPQAATNKYVRTAYQTRGYDALKHPFSSSGPPPTSRRRSGARGEQRGGFALLPEPSDSFSGERCWQDPLTPHSPGPH